MQQASDADPDLKEVDPHFGERTSRSHHSLLCTDVPMDVDDKREAAAGVADPAAASKLRASDLHSQHGVGRCYYTQLPRLVKVRLVCALTS